MRNCTKGHLYGCCSGDCGRMWGLRGLVWLSQPWIPLSLMKKWDKRWFSRMWVLGFVDHKTEMVPADRSRRGRRTHVSSKQSVPTDGQGKLWEWASLCPKARLDSTVRKHRWQNLGFLSFFSFGTGMPKWGMGVWGWALFKKKKKSMCFQQKNNCL